MQTQLIPTPFGHVAITEDINGIKLSLSPVPLPENITPERCSDLSLSLIQAIKSYLDSPESAVSSLIDFKQLSGTPYQRRVWQAIAKIPVGTTQTYSQLAEQLQSCPRAVANACGANRIPILIPCHRVVAKSGLGGFMRNHPEGSKIKRWLLNHEGVYV